MARECDEEESGLLAATSAIDHILGLLLPTLAALSFETDDCGVTVAVGADGMLDGGMEPDCFWGELFSVSKSLKSTKNTCLPINIRTRY